MLKHFRETVKHMPIAGPILYGLYLRWRFHEGQTLQIKQGYLKGTRLYRFVRTIHEHFAEGDYEMPLQGALLRELKPGHTFFDIGANAGFFTLLAAKAVGTNGQVVAYEAHPVTASQIRKQLKLNAVTHAQVIAKAVSDQEGEAEFTDDIASDMLGLADLRTDSPKFTIRVPTTTIDLEVAQWGIPNVIKIDIEGAEILALRGMTKLLKTPGLVLLVELHGDVCCEQFYDLLTPLGYQFEQLNGEPISNCDKQRFVIARSPGSPPSKNLS